jgi:hypothetical protein
MPEPAYALTVWPEHQLHVHTLLYVSRCACADVDVLNQVADGCASRTWDRRVHRGRAAQCACPGDLVVDSAGAGDRPELARALPLIGWRRPRKGGWIRRWCRGAQSPEEEPEKDKFMP